MRLALLLLLAVTGCSSGGGDTVASDPAASEPAASEQGGAVTRLEVQVSADQGAEPQRWTLTCDPAGGDHPAPEQACQDLERESMPFAPVATDTVCTQLFGGPQTAVVRGAFHGEPVSLELSRTDGCRVAQWDRLGAVLPALP